MTEPTPTPTEEPNPLKDVQILIPGEVVQKILNFLAAKPFQEVAELIDLLRKNAKQVKFNDEPTPTSEPQTEETV